MMKKFLFFISLIFLIFSCDDKKQYLGHWHEFTNNNPDFGECIIINDSSFSINKLTQGGDFGIYKDFNQILLSAYYDSLVYKNYDFKNDKILINDSIKWIRQSENNETFINDYSAGLKIKINPFNIKFRDSDTIEHFKKKLIYYIFIGKKKNKEELFLQLNEKVTKEQIELIRFLNCNHCKVDDYNYIIIPDKTVSKNYIETIYNSMKSINIKKRNIYIQYIDTSLNKIGFKNIIDFEKLLK